MNSRYLEDMVTGYLECAAWSSIDPGTEEPIEDSADTWTEQAKAKATEDCKEFMEQAGERLLEYWDGALAGHAFWLTRNHHGSGFWDSGMGVLGDQLTKIAHSYGGVDAYITDEGLIDFM